MSSGPITIFDKSALQALSIDEACWLDNFYLCNITPLFFAETLADLKRQMAKGRAAEKVVGNLAAKTPVFGTVNAHHSHLSLGDLLGYPVSMTRRPILPSGTTRTTGDRTGITFERAPEMEAFERWQDGRFLEVEQQFARVWREALRRTNLVEISESLRNQVREKMAIRTLEEAKTWAGRAVDGTRNRFSLLKQALGLLAISPEHHAAIVSRWKASDGQPLRDFAPYAAHVIEVTLFFRYSLAAGLISPERASNNIDIAYLYYLPFCMLFVSNDKLHQRTVPLFLTKDQTFVEGMQLKRDLAKLDEHYLNFPESVREQGIMSFASYPPSDGDFLTAKLWDRFLPRWRELGQRPIARTQESDQLLVEMLQKIDKASPIKTSIGTDEADFMMTVHRVPARRGKWRIVSREVEAAEGR
jgi:hypothetical protein